MPLNWDNSDPWDGRGTMTITADTPAEALTELKSRRDRTYEALVAWTEISR